MQSSQIGQVADGTGADVRNGLNESDAAIATDFEGIEAPANPLPAMTWRNDDAGLVMRRNQTNDKWLIVENYKATSDPDENWDETLGYIIGSKVHNIVDSKLFFCLNAADGAANWVDVAAAGGLSAIELRVDNGDPQQVKGVNLVGARITEVVDGVATVQILGGGSAADDGILDGGTASSTFDVTFIDGGSANG